MKFPTRGIACITLGAIGALTSAANAQVMTENAPGAVIDAWTSRIWDTAREGQEDTLLQLLGTLPGQTDADIAESYRASIELFRENHDKRESTRAEQIEEVSTEFDEHLASFDAGARADLTLNKALESAVELQLLMKNDDGLFAQQRVTRLIEAASDAAGAAEARADWLIANELFFRLSVLLQAEGAYKDDVERLGRRLTMIRLYAPERLWELRNERRLADDEEPLPPYNPYGDGYQEKLSNVSERMVTRALARASYQHVEGVALANMLDGGLDAIETLATTGDLKTVFPGLASDFQRTRFLATLDRQRDLIAKAGPRPDANRIIHAVLNSNAETIGVLETALLHEFGNGAMSELDDYSAIIWPDELARFRRSTQGEFIGVGIQIQMDELQNIKVVTPLEGTPAQIAGIRSGDLIKKVDDRSTIGFTLDQAVEVITGPANSDVMLTIERELDDGTKTALDFPITRKRIPLRTVKGWRKLGAGDYDWDWFADKDAGVGYVRLTGFTEDTAEDFDRAVAQMRRDGLSSLILDLRFNPGGLLDQAVAISNRFIDKGLIVKTEDAQGQPKNQEIARSIPKSKRLEDIPVVVLINEGSASASEIVSGAIQAAAAKPDAKLQAIVIGQRSFGKGSVQNVYALDGPVAAMKLTTQYYKLDSNRLIHRKPGSSEWGIDPDLAVEMLPEQISESITIRRESDILPLDEFGNIVEQADRPDPNRLITEGIDLQMQTALVILQTQQASGKLVSNLPGG